MRTARLINGMTVIAAGGAEAQAQATTTPARKPGTRAKELFIGSDTAGAQFKSSILPTATDLESMAQKLNGRLRNVDPFGVSTFPRDAESLPPSDAPVRPTERVTLNQALQTLRLTGINIATKEVLIAGRSVFEGDVMMLSFKNELFLAQILQVGPSQILFRDLKRQETGALPHTLLPHLEMEPMQNRTRKDSLEGKVTAIEPLTSPSR